MAAEPDASQPEPQSFAAASPSLLARLEAISRDRPDRVLRLRGSLPAEATVGGEEPMVSRASDTALQPSQELFELLIFRGFSSSTTHPTDFDPDQPALPAAATISSAELLQAPLRPGEIEHLVAGPGPVEPFLEPEAWR